MGQFNRGLPSQQSCARIKMVVLESAPYEVWEYVKVGCEAAKIFMKSDLRVVYVNMKLSFNGGKAITYERCRKIRSTVQDVIRRCIYDKSLRQEVLHD